ncbi:ABC transporter substrate-binding protein [Paraoerskovia marina]|uniref:ABC transporter substrate-binding protein n=1 Tax=Paraoerskovia marina TaxID=545619 RepID=UPI00049238D2|nr:extracellular solute-binding protein [Paraoerskovia marina]
MRTARFATAVALTASIGLLTACGGDDGSTTNADGDVVITWWHNANTGEGKTFYDDVAAEFEAEHPGVVVEVSAMQHEDMLTKLDAAFQSGEAPSLYMERGGGELQDHVEAGLTKDLTDLVPETIDSIGGSIAGWQVDDRTYGLPFSVGVVGFWYNKALFADAGIDTPPTTVDEFDDAVAQLKDAGITPVSVGAGDKWPAAHYWYYFAMRECSEQVLSDAVGTLDFSDDCFVRAGGDLEQLVGTEPFNAGFLSTPAQSGPTSASGLLATDKVAMELAGHWEPGVMQGLTEDEQGLGDDTGWFAFPSVDGGEGAPDAALGGGDAWAVSQDAPDEAVELAEYLLSDDVQKRFAELDMGLPTNSSASEFVADPALAQLLEVRDAAPYVQLYFDTAFGPSVGGAMNDEIALMFAGQAGPQDVVDATQAAADAEK